MGGWKKFLNFFILSANVMYWWLILTQLFLYNTIDEIKEKNYLCLFIVRFDMYGTLFWSGFSIISIICPFS